MIDGQPRPVQGVDYTVTIGEPRRFPPGRTVVVSSPLLSRAIHPRQAIAVVGVGVRRGANGPEWCPSAFQLASWTEYLRSQATIEPLLATRLWAAVAKWKAGSVDDVWQHFAVEAVILEDREQTLPPRAERQAAYTRFLKGRGDPVMVQRALDNQERLFTGTANSAFDVALSLTDDEHQWIASFRSGELVDVHVD